MSKNTVCYNGLTFEPYITKEEIAQRIQELARQIEADCKDSAPLFLVVLNGSFPFASDLFRQVKIHDAEISFIRLKSYEGTGTTGQVKQVMGLNENIEGRTVIIVEDIIDTGFTMKRLIKDLEVFNPEQIKIATLLFKPESLKTDVKPDYIGFNIPPAFIIGYGLDIDGKARNLEEIYVICKDAEEDKPEENKPEEEKQ